MIKILSIDGGGIRGLIPALVLAEIEKKTQQPISQSFDLIAGTSTGGILTYGLSKPTVDGRPALNASELVTLYEQHGAEIFDSSLMRTLTSAAGVLDELYAEQGLERVLEKYFGESTIGESLTPTVVTTYDIERRKPLFLKSWKQEHANIPMKLAARATSAAPTYFEPASIPVNGEPRALIDGGVFINSPAVSAFVEAKRMFPQETQFMLVSLGTGELTRPIKPEQAKGWGKLEWLVPLLDSMFDGVSDTADYQMRVLLGSDYYRLQTSLTIASDDLDEVTPENIADLRLEAEKLISERRAQVDEVCERIMARTAVTI